MTTLANFFKRWEERGRSITTLDRKDPSRPNTDGRGWKPGRPRSVILSKEVESALVSERLLKEWAPYSLTQRVALMR